MQMKNNIELISEEDIRNASLKKMFIVRVSFPNKEFQPIYLASSKQIKREDVSNYLRLNSYNVDEYRIINWTPKEM